MGKKTPEVVAEALAAGDIDKASAFLYAETHHQLACARKDGMPHAAIMDEVSEAVLACLKEPVTGYSQRERALARAVVRFAIDAETVPAWATSMESN